MTYYTALTIGPIYKTIANARRTRELWAASYTFSYLMKQILKKLYEDKTRTFFLPCVTDGELNAPGQLGAGVFPDRLIYGALQGEGEKLRRLADGVLSDFAGQIAPLISRDKESVIVFLKKYFRFYVIEKELSDGKNPILELTPYLDAIECQASYSVEHEKFLETFFNRVNTTFLVDDGYGNDKKFVSYQTLVEIAAKEFSNDHEYIKIKDNRENKEWYGSPRMKEGDDKKADKDDSDLIQYLRGKEKFRAAHKYVAIVHSDGDNIGKIIKSLKTPKEFEDFSQALSRYSREAVKTIDEYGGMPIYAGGDDLLFFAPVINKTNNIINLLVELDSAFTNLFNESKVSLSFGVSISYYKFPLFEALEASRALLYETKKGRKHNIALRVQKNSGWSFGETLHLPSDSFKCFKELLDKHGTDKKGMLSSIVYKIHENQKLFSLIGQNFDKVNNFINNSFNEREHDEAKEFLADVKRLIYQVFKDTSDDKKALAQIYSMLRIISFFTEKDER